MLREEIDALIEQVANRQIELSDLPLHLEPLLWKARDRASDEATIRVLMNNLELILFTQKEEDQLSAALRLLDEAQRFVVGKLQHDD